MVDHSDGVGDEFAGLNGNGAALLALREYEPETPGERVLLNAMRALSRIVRQHIHKVDGVVLALGEQVGLAVEEARHASGNAVALQDELLESRDTMRRVLEVMGRVDRTLHGAEAGDDVAPKDRPSRPATPESKRASAAPAEASDTQPAPAPHDEIPPPADGDEDDHERGP